MENFDDFKLINEPRPTKKLAEECFQIKIGYFGKGLLCPSPSLDTHLGIGNHASDFIINKSGKIRIAGARGLLFLTYKFQSGDYPTLDIFFTKDPGQIDGGRPQSITLELQELNYGTRWYFKCQCGRRCNQLYSPSGGEFACRGCLNLAYESTRINKHTMGGLLYYTHRKIKLSKIRENIDRISYDGRPTKRATRFFRMLGKLEDSVDPQTRLLAGGSFERALA